MTQKHEKIVCSICTCVHMGVPVCAYTSHVLVNDQHRVSSPSCPTAVVLFIYFFFETWSLHAALGVLELSLCRPCPQTNKTYACLCGF